MRNYILSLITGILIALIGLPTLSAQSKVGTTVAPFLTLGTGARGSALGHAYTSSARGADALFWNVSGIAIVEDRTPQSSVFFTNYQWVADIQYNAAAVKVPIGYGYLGAHIATVDYGRMEVRTIDMPYGTGERFGANDLVAGLSYAQALTNRFYVGGTIKYISQSIWDMRASTAAIDIGFTLVTPYLNGLVLAASMQNFGGQMTLDGVNTRIFIDPDLEADGNNDRVPADYALDSWNLPLSFKFGITAPVIKTDRLGWELMAESHQTNDQYLNADFGTQLRLSTKATNLYVRTGYRDLGVIDVDGHISYGIGLDTYMNGFRVGFDAAVLPFNNLGSSTMVDLRLHF